MCGIIGYVRRDGGDAVLDVLLNGLNRLEYRGYDSAGIAIANGTLDVHKRAGELDVLTRSLDGHVAAGDMGVGHTRWSTHGAPTDANAHPHVDCNDRVAVVHNGIIENYHELRQQLSDRGHRFVSETDTEVVPHLIEEGLAAGLSAEEAFREAVDAIDGSYAIAAMVADDGRRIFGTRHESPLVVGIGEHGNYLGSDVPAFIDYTDEVIYLDDGEVVEVAPEGVSVSDPTGQPIEKDVNLIEWDPEEAGKSGYEHFMLKEIHEQPAAIRKCLRNRVEELTASIDLPEIAGVPVEAGVHLVACGTSYHAAMYGAQLLRAEGITAQYFLASEYNETSVPIPPGTTVIGVTQSGETADTLSALRAANRAGAHTVAVTNVVESSAVRECDDVMYIRAGPEIGVAATKTFVTQVIALAMVAAVVSEAVSAEFVEQLRALPDQVQGILDRSIARQVADTYLDADAYFFIGRGWNVPVALEGALKMKEITYKHAEGFAAGELKHGPLALVTARTPVFALVTDGNAPEKTLGNIKEVEARDAPVIAVTDVPDRVRPYADAVLEVPQAGRQLTPLLANVQLQLASYWVANLLGRSIDKPRNLAKSVTVE